MCLPGYLFPDPGRGLHDSLQSLSRVAAPVNGQMKAKTKEKKKQCDWPGEGHHSLFDDPCTAKAVFRLCSPISEPKFAEDDRLIAFNVKTWDERNPDKVFQAHYLPKPHDCCLRCCEQTELLAHLAQFCPDVFGCLGTAASSELHWNVINEKFVEHHPGVKEFIATAWCGSKTDQSLPKVCRTRPAITCAGIS